MFFIHKPIKIIFEYFNNLKYTKMYFTMKIEFENIYVVKLCAFLTDFVLNYDVYAHMSESGPVH